MNYNRKGHSTMAALLLLFSAASMVATAYTVGGRTELRRTRTSRWLSTKPNAGFTTRAAAVVDDEQSSDDRWFFPWPKEDILSKQSTPAPSEDEKAVDEYLEFLDRRYRRLHESAPEQQPQFALSAWKWLKQDPVESATDVNQQQQQEDALFVLGVAGLASKRLLQKHHIPADSKPLEAGAPAATASQVEANVVDVSPETLATTAAVSSLTSSSSRSRIASQAFARLAHSRMALHKYQNDQVRAAAAFCIRGPIRLCRSLWRMGGGRYTVLRTMTITAALMLVLVRPLLHFVAHESLNMTRGA